MALTPQAAWASLAAANVKASERVLIHGAGGSVGHFLVQLSKAKGVAISAMARPSEVDAMRALSTDEVIDCTETRFEELGMFDVVFDLVGGETQTRSWAALKRGGRLISTASPPSAEMAKAVDAKGIFVFTQPDGAVLQQIATMTDEGPLRPLPITQVFPFDQLPEAHRLGQSGKSGGKMVLKVAQG